MLPSQFRKAPNDGRDALILLRATILDERTRAFAERLSEAAQDALCYVVDGRYPEPRNLQRPFIPITKSLCESRGLYCPPDFAWRCGDYGLYLARERFPEERFMWQIEFDVRFCGVDEHAFFKAFDGVDADFLAVHLRPAGRDYRWYTFGSGRSITPWRCLFPLTRFSACALDLLLERRRKHGRSRQRRSTWPNDEVFVATTIQQERLKAMDFNNFGSTYYTDATFQFHQPFRGEDLDSAVPPAGIYHPVLFGADYEKKMERTKRRPSSLQTWPWIEQRLRRSFNHFFAW